MKKKEPAPPHRGGYEDCGFCSYCLLSLEAKQPGGREPRHKATLTPYLKCPQALRAMDNKKATSKTEFP